MFNEDFGAVDAAKLKAGKKTSIQKEGNDNLEHWDMLKAKRNFYKQRGDQLREEGNEAEANAEYELALELHHQLRDSIYAVVDNTLKTGKYDEKDESGEFLRHQISKLPAHVLKEYNIPLRFSFDANGEYRVSYRQPENREAREMIDVAEKELDEHVARILIETTRQEIHDREIDAIKEMDM